MLKILQVTPTLEYRGAARQLCLLASSLPREEFETIVCCLGPAGPLTEMLGTKGVRVEALGWTRVVDVVPFLQLHRLLQTFRPDILHVWGLTSLRTVRLLRSFGSPPLVLSAPLLGRETLTRLDWLDRQLLHGVRRVVASTSAEELLYRRIGLGESACVRIPPAVNVAEPERNDEKLPQLPEAVRLLGWVGPIERHKGFPDAIWAFDVLRYLFDDLHALFIGAFKGGDHLAQFMQVTDRNRKIHLLGARADVPRLLEHVEVVWVPSFVPSGLNVTLEAMAAGKPVVATELPGLSDIIVHGETGFLFPRGDKIALARFTRMLLEDADLRRRMGEAGRRRAEEHFAVAAMAQSFGHLYREASGV